MDSKRILREIKLLLNMKHKNIVNLVDIIKPDDPSDFNDLYLVFEYMQCDLSHIIKKLALKPNHIKTFIF